MSATGRAGDAKRAPSAGNAAASNASVGMER